MAYQSGDGNTDEKPADPISAETLGIIDSTQIGNELWMVRIPPKLAEAWSKAEAGASLGDLVFRKGGKQNGKAIKPSLKVKVERSIGEEDAALPLDYTLEAFTKRVPVLHPFSRHDHNGQVSIHGTVSRTANLQASKTDQRYLQHRKNRLVQTNVNKKAFVMPVEATELSVRKSMNSDRAGFGNAVQAFGQRIKDAATSSTAGDEARKRKYEEKPTRSVLFELFQYRTHWTMKELRQESGKPEKELRHILNEIGTYHRSGEFKNMWSLKAELSKNTAGGSK